MARWRRDRSRAARARDAGTRPLEREPPIDRRPEFLPSARRRDRLGALEVLAVSVVLLALLALAVWFFFFAHNPLLHP